ncbi:hypothetical protein FACS1894142_3450 [Spirochaetia bacterium]|nr:hypothetical protein FACS1894142_3450 [Spirochaetia bacterium]
MPKKNKPGKQHKGQSLLPIGIREAVIKLNRLGWNTEEIAGAEKLSVGEVEKIIEMGVENQAARIMPDSEKKEVLTEEALLEHFAKIVGLVKGKSLEKPFIEEASHHLDVVSKELCITPIQAAMYAHVFDTSLNAPPILAKPGRFLYFGYPGSGTAKQLAEDAMLLFQDGTRYTIIGYDEYHAGIHQNLRTYAEIIGISYEEFNGPDYRLSWMLDQKGIETALIYLRGFSQPDRFCYTYKSLFCDKDFTKFLVLDCTRKDELNLSLIAGIGRENIDAVMLTKIDMIRDEVPFFDYIHAIDLPIAGFSDNEDLSLPNDLWYKRRSAYAIPLVVKRH